MPARGVAATPRSRMSSAAAATIRCRVWGPRRVSRRPSPAPFLVTARPYHKLDWTTQFFLAMVGRVTQLAIWKETDMTFTDLAGTTALVTGATSGIGRAAALSLPPRGAHLLVRGPHVLRGPAAA